MTRKTSDEKLQYTITHLPNRMTEDLTGRRDLIVAALASKPHLKGSEWYEGETAILNAIESIIQRREMAR